MTWKDIKKVLKWAAVALLIEAVASYGYVMYHLSMQRGATLTEQVQSSVVDAPITKGGIVKRVIGALTKGLTQSFKGAANSALKPQPKPQAAAQPETPAGQIQPTEQPQQEQPAPGDNQ